MAEAVPTRRCNHGPRAGATKGAALALTVVLLLRGSAEACDAVTQARIDFIESRLTEGQKHAAWWWKGWMTVFVAGALVESLAAGTEKNNGKRADDIITVVESVAGVADLAFDPIVAKEGARALQAMPRGDNAQCAARLAAAEETLKTAAEQVHDRTSWQEHLIELVINLGAGLAVSEGWGERSTGWSSFAVGESFSEAQIWTLPTRPIDDLNAYRETFDAAPPIARNTPTGWHLGASPGGLRLVRNF